MDKYYTITISLPIQGELEGVFLYDKETGIYTPLTDGAQYTYTHTGESDRLAIVEMAGDAAQRDKAVKYIRQGHLYMEKEGAIYDALGRKIGETK